MLSGTRQAALLSASQVVGGFDALSERLRISRPALRAMLEGRIGVPQRVFFELVDIIAMQSPVDPSRPGRLHGGADFLDAGSA